MRNAPVDFHTHILPGIDDGSKSLQESISLLRAEAEQGICHVVATPHFYARNDRLDQFLERRARAEEALRREMAKYGGLPEITVGAEVSFFRKMSESELLPRLTIGRKRYMLIEMPSSPWTEDMFEELRRIYERQSITPVIAHVDRYIGPLRTYGIPGRLERLPVLVQANSGFFMKAATQPLAMRMLRSGQIHLLGSDCHNMTDRRPNLGEAVRRIEKKLGPEALAAVQGYTYAILGDALAPV